MSETLYIFCGQEIQFPFQIPSLKNFKQTGAEIFSAPVNINLPHNTISHSKGWIAGANRSVEVRNAGDGYILRVSGFRDFYIAPFGKAILPIKGDSEINDLEQEVVLGPGLVLALALGSKWCLHASAVTFENQGMAFLGESGYGKSTLAAFLDETAKPGWQRVADDILPVSLGEGGLTGWTHFPQLKLPARKQPLLSQPETVGIHHICLLDPDNSSITPILKQLTSDEVVRILLGNTAGARLLTPELLAAHLSFCAQAAKFVTGYRLSYAHRQELLPVVQDFLDNIFTK